MSLQHPNILYVGNVAAGKVLLQTVTPDGWWVYQPSETLEALGIYITYLPDITVIDASVQPDFTGEVYEHLRSIQAQPLLVLTNDPTWNAQILLEQGVYLLSPSKTPGQLKAIISFILRHKAEEKNHAHQLLALAGD